MVDPTNSDMLPLLRVALDGRSLRAQRTGVGTYTINLLEHLLLDDSLQIALFLDAPIPALQIRGAGGLKAVECRPLIRNNILWSNFSVPAQLRRETADLFHSPGYTLPLRLTIPTVVSIHDVSYEAQPQWYPYRRGAIRRLWYRLSAIRADRIITISEFSKREIQRAYSIAPEKVCLIYPGVDRRIFKRIGSEDDLIGLKKKYEIEGEYLLYVGDIHPRRNVKRIIEAFSLVRDSLPHDRRLELVVIGRVLDHSTRIEIEKMQRNVGGVRLLGYVPEEDLPMFYSAARAFLFPSFYEGFGLGVLEAMACGCPVVVARGTACAEAAGEAGISVDPWSSRSIADAAASLITNSSLSTRCSQLGLERAERFSWSRAAAETLNLYRQITHKRIP